MKSDVRSVAWLCRWMGIFAACVVVIGAMLLADLVSLLSSIFLCYLFFGHTA